MAGARETSCFGGPTSTFRDGRKGSEQFYADVVAGAALWTSWLSSRCSGFVTGAVNRSFSACGSFADFVADTALCEP